MQGSLIVKGRLVGPTSVELDEPVVGMTAEVEVVMRPRADAAAGRPLADEPVSQFLRNLRVGTRSKEEIDRQIQSERESWGAR
jgi:hypothetical protein